MSSRQFGDKKMKCRDNSPNEIERQVTAHLVYKGQLALLYRFLETKLYCHEILQFVKAPFFRAAPSNIGGGPCSWMPSCP